MPPKIVSEEDIVFKDYRNYHKIIKVDKSEDYPDGLMLKII